MAAPQSRRSSPWGYYTSDVTDSAFGCVAPTSEERHRRVFTPAPLPHVRRLDLPQVREDELVQVAG